MPARIQSLILGLGIPKQADIATIATVATAFQRFKKLDMDITLTVLMVSNVFMLSYILSKTNIPIATETIGTT